MHGSYCEYDSINTTSKGMAVIVNMTIIIKSGREITFKTSD